MRWFIDGNQLVIMHDDFVDLQESPAVFLPADSKKAKTVMRDGVKGLAIGDLMRIRHELAKQRR